MNNIIIGDKSGMDLTENDRNYFILGDNISVEDVKNKRASNCIYFDSNYKICISKDMLSEKALEIIENHLNIIS